MKKLFFAVALAALPLIPALAAEGTAHAGKHKQSATADMDQEQIKKMQENMLRMHEQMHKIMDAKSPQEREQLLQAHAKMMQDGMQMMKSMKSGHPMMGSDAGGSMKDGAKMDGSSKMDNPHPTDGTAQNEPDPRNPQPNADRMNGDIASGGTGGGMSNM